MEDWRQIESFENYEASNKGRIRRSAKIKGNNDTGSEGILKECIRKDGYAQLTLSVNGVHSTHLVHRLIAEAFYDHPKGKDTVHHVNGNRGDNRAENLVWMEQSEHLKSGDRAKKSGLARRKPVDMFTKDGKFICSFDGAVTAEAETGCDRKHISDCCLKRRGRKSCGGYVWRFKGDEF